MTYDKEKYEKLIQESPLFTLDKATQISAYKREALKMVEYLYCYLLSINQSKYDPYGCEIVDVATRCINGYDQSSDFLHYFNAAWKKEYSHICGNQILEDKFKGVKISEQEKRDVKKFLMLLSKKGSNLSDQEVIKQISILMDIAEEKVAMIAKLSATVVVGEYTNNMEGEEVSILDQIASEILTDQNIEKQESLLDLMSLIDEIFTNLQERQRPIVSDLLTAKIGIEIMDWFDEISRFSFVNDEMLINIRETGVVPTQREIADKYKRNEASISRTMKEFIKNIQLRYKGEE